MLKTLPDRNAQNSADDAIGNIFETKVPDQKDTDKWYDMICKKIFSKDLSELKCLIIASPEDLYNPLNYLKRLIEREPTPPPQIFTFP